MIRWVCYLAVIPLVFSALPEIAWSQDEGPDQETQDQESVQQDEQPSEPGLELLDLSMQKKLAVRNMRDLKEVVSLAEKAISLGLSDGDQDFAKQLIGATYYEQAERLAQMLDQGPINLAWARRREMALESVAKAIEFRPQDPDAYLLNAQLHEQAGGNTEEGLRAATRAVELFQDYPARRSLALMAKASFTSDAKERLEYLEQAVADDPKSAEARRERGEARWLAEDPEGAIEDLKFVLEKDSSDLDAFQRVAQILVSQEKFDDAIEFVTDSIRSHPEEPSGYTLRSSVYAVQEKYDLAETDLDKAMELNPRSIATLMARARMFEIKGDHKEAMADATRVLELEPGMLSALLLRSEIAISAGIYTRAISDLRRLLREAPRDVTLRMRLARVYLADSNPKMAISTFDQILRDHPEAWNAVTGKADAMLNTGEHVLAVKEYERALEALPDDSGVLNNFAWVLATSTMDELRDGERALDLAKKACEITEYKQAHILSTLAAAYAETGDFDAATEWSAKAVELGQGEIKEQLGAELASYREKKPWRERQTIESEEGSLAEALQTDLTDDAQSATPSAP